jgi:hypothetical protein
MNKRIKEPKYAHVKRYYERKKKDGWRSYLVFGPEDLLDSVKAHIRQYRIDHNLYERVPKKRM